MTKIKLKNNKFEAIQTSGFSEQFGELKHFCGENIKISYESCYIDDYWLIQVYDCLKDKWVVVPNYDYIISIPNIGFTVMSASDYTEYFIEDEQV